jgi:hypothetical protein
MLLKKQGLCVLYKQDVYAWFDAPALSVRRAAPLNDFMLP